MIPLSQPEEQALRAFASRLQHDFSRRVLQLSLFGSKARGEGGPDSDLDVFVLIDQDDRALRRAIIDLASQVSLEYDVLLSPRVISVQRWEAMRGFTFRRNVTRDAVAIPMR